MINNYIKENKDCFRIISGFKTKEFLEDGWLKGYYLEDQLSPQKDYTLVGINKLFPKDKQCQGITEGFETRGVEILNNALYCQSDLVLMDELGFFEKEAIMFQQKVYKLLEGKTKVLGVIKKKSNPFLESIKKREDVIIMEVTSDNREEIPKRINKIWRDKHEE